MSGSRGLTTEATLMGYASCNNAHGDSLLHWAIRKRYASLARQLILSGVPTNLPNDEGETPLHLAVAANDLEACKLLVASTGSLSLLHLMDKRGRSSVELAIIKLFCGSSTDDSILDCLVQQGARPLQHEAQWFRAFCFAIHSGNSVVLDVFLRHGKSLLDKHPTTGETTLHVVLQFNTSWGMALAPIKLLLEAGVDVNAVHNGLTALHIAAQRPDGNDVVRCLVEHGAKVDGITAGPGDGDTRLVGSILTAEVENARALIEAGANVFHSFGEGPPPFHLAALAGRREILELLLTAGVQVNTLDKAGETAAYWACRNGHLDCLKFLVSQGLDPKAGKTDLMKEAIKRTDLPIVECLWDYGMPITMQYLDHLLFKDTHYSRWDMLNFLMRHLELLPQNRDGGIESHNDAHAHSSAYHVVHECHPILAAAYLEAGHKIRIDDELCAILLSVCAQYGLLSGTRNLLGVARSWDKVRKYHNALYGWSALEIAACLNEVALVQLLLEHGWDPNHEDLRGRASLHLAALCGAAAVVKELLDVCNIHHKDKNWDTPLHLAACSGSASVLELLVDDEGKGVHRRNKDGETPLGIACKEGHAVAVRWLLDQMGDSSHLMLGPLHHAARGNHMDCMEHLIAARFDVNGRHAGGNTPLHAAATGGSWKAVSRLLKAGADPNCPNDQGKTPSALAFSRTDVPPDVITELLEKTTLDWDLPLSQSILFNVCVGGNETAITAVLGRLSQDRPEKAKKTVRRLLPELLGELCTSGPAAKNSTAYSLLLSYLHSSSKKALSETIISATIVAGDDVELAQLLVDANPGITDLRTPQLWTMLHFACRYGRIKIARLLLANGAPAWAEGEDGVTALGMAKKYLEGDILERFVDLFRGYEAVLKALKENEELPGLILAAQSGIGWDSNNNDGC
ncbi:hypothetical protein RB594_000395 [Gaeumannomyces avenae]